jgi:uncharacterized membrane protein YhaH (DUF805 family)
VSMFMFVKSGEKYKNVGKYEIVLLFFSLFINFYISISHANLYGDKEKKKNRL